MNLNKEKRLITNQFQKQTNCNSKASNQKNKKQTKTQKTKTKKKEKKKKKRGLFSHIPIYAGDFTFLSFFSFNIKNKNKP